jgi:tetratricopeptide (TPR) repeat protein
MRNVLLALTLVACNTPRSPHGSPIPWIEDDYARALAEARAADKPLVVDAWATWCHTCLSMKNFVFTDPAFGPVADRFVWLSLDTERPESAPVLAKFPVTAWPTFFVIDPRDESVSARWLGSATAVQFKQFLADGQAEMRRGGSDPRSEADRAALAKDWRRAAELYGRAGDRPDVLVSRLDAYWKAGDLEACTAFAKEKMDRTGDSQSAIDFAMVALACADKQNDDDLRRLVETRLTGLVADRYGTRFAIDDLGFAYITLFELREKRGDKEGAKRAAEDLLRDLGDAARKAPDAYAASTFNVARAIAYVYLGRGREAVAMLEASEKALPNDYNPPFQLARVLRDLGDYDAALAAVDRSLPKAYGPRKGGILGVRAELFEKKGDLAAAARAYDEQAAFYESLPVEQRPAERLAKARENASRCRKEQAAAGGGTQGG